MMYGRSVEVKIELGHKAVLKDQPTAEGYTHDWTVFVKGPEGCKIDNFVEKVIFMLHESFPKSKRTIREPPYQVTESGYAGFNMPIWVYFKTREEPKKIDFVYDLYLSLDGKPINNIRCEKLTFHNPPDDFCQRLLKGGGSIKQPVASPNKKSSGPQTPPEKRSPQQPQTQPAGAAAKPSSDLFGGSNAKDIKSGTAPAQDGKKEKKKEKRSKDYKKEKKDKDGRSRSDKDKEAAPSSREEKTTSKEKERDKESSKSEKERDKAETKADQERDSKLKENTKDKERTSGKESKDKEATAKQKEGSSSSSSSSKKLASVRSSQSPPMAADMKKDDTKNREDRKRPAGISPSEGSGERDREKTNNDDKEVKRKKKSSSHKDSPDAKKPRLTQDQLTSGSSESLKSKRSKSRGKESLASSPFVESNDDMELSFTPSPPESKSALRPPSDRKRSAPKDKSASPTERKEVRPPPPPTSRSKKAAATPSSSSSPSPMHSVSAPTNSSNRKKSPNKQSAQQQQQQPIGALAAMMMEMDAESVSSPEPDDRRRDKLSVLKVKILKLSDEKLQQVVDIIEMTGKYELSNESFDFDLQQIDNLTINRLQQLVS